MAHVWVAEKRRATTHAPESHFLRKLVPNQGPAFPISSDLPAGKGLCRKKNVQTCMCGHVHGYMHAHVCARK